MVLVRVALFIHMQLEAFLSGRRPLLIGYRPRSLEWVMTRGFLCIPRHTFMECLAIRRMYKVTSKRKKDLGSSRLSGKKVTYRFSEK